MYSFKSTMYPLLSSPNSACKCPQNLDAKAKFVLAVEKFIIYSYIL